MSSAQQPPDVLLGLIGYTPVLASFPLGPPLMQRLTDEPWEGVRVRVENMSWSPIHIVQWLQEEERRYSRLVLVGAADRCGKPGRIRCHSWQGGRLPDAALQERIYEAVTGIVCLDNTLIIGSHFDVWPAEVITVELELQPNTFGDLVIAESNGIQSGPALRERIGFDPIAAGARLARLAIDCARFGARAELALLPKSAASLAPIRSFSHSHALLQ